MKFDIVKTLIALAIALLLGFVCEIIAPEAEGRNWISLGVGAVSIFSVLLPAMGLRYENAPRGASIKMFAWMMTVALVITNVVFSCFEYKVENYLVVVLLLVVISWGIFYGMYSAKIQSK